MRRFLLTIIAIIAFISTTQAQSKINLNASKIRAELKDNSTVILLPISNFSDQPIKAAVSLYWLNTEDVELSKIQESISIPSGHTEIEIPFPLKAPSIWTRLRYALMPESADARAFTPLNGIASLAHIAPHAFEMKLSSLGHITRANGNISVFGEAVHPVTRMPLSGVNWDATLTIGDKQLKPAKIQIPEKGFVEFVFNLPEAMESLMEQAVIKATGRMGDFTQNAEIQIEINHHISAHLQTDKPIYQPGQTIHTRAVILDSSGRVAQSEKINLLIQDADEEDIHSAHLISSKFGIIQDEWTIPNTAAAGMYLITITAQNDDAWKIVRHYVRVSRYELPFFSVAAKPSKMGYLPGENATVTVAGTYLFGKPVPNGKVRIVKLEESYRRSRDNDKQEIIAEGEADAQGIFTAQINLKKDHEDFIGRYYEQFKDINFAAYFTDASSGRTEQRRFDLRLTHDQIHIYTFGPGSGGSLPAPSYITTCYPDGQPAATSIEITLDGRGIHAKTNRDGIAKIFLVGSGTRDDHRRDNFIIKVVDAAGKTGELKRSYWMENGEPLRMESSRTLYRPGESVTLQITSPAEMPPDQLVMVHALLGDKKRITGKMVRIVNHKAEVTFPYQDEFRRTINFVAWDAFDPKTSYETGVLGSKAVIFPDSTDIKVNASMDRSIYQPGETASLHMKAVASDGKPVEAALGIAIVDQSVLERARTDAGFGQRSWFSCAFCWEYDNNEIAGFRLNDLYNLKPATPITPELDLIAEAFAAKSSVYLTGKNSENAANTPSFKTITVQMDELEDTLRSYFYTWLKFPQNPEDLSGMLGSKWVNLRDPWESPYYSKFRLEGNNLVLSIWSNGPDKKQKTADDFVAGTIKHAYFRIYDRLIQNALARQDYPATNNEFLEILHNNGLLFESLWDPWGSPYKVSFDTQGSTRRIFIYSAGPDRDWKTDDDVYISNFGGPYFSKNKSEISEAVNKARFIPKTMQDFQEILANAGIDLSKLFDAWNRPYKLISSIGSYYDDRIRNKTVQIYGEPIELKIEKIPITKTYVTFSLRSDGPDLVATWDDFNIADFSFLLKEESPQPNIAQTPVSLPATGTGRISGTVRDQTGAVIPEASVLLIQNSVVIQTITTDINGDFLISSIAEGSYLLRINRNGFMEHDVIGIPVSTGETINIDIALRISNSAISTEIIVSTSAENLILESGSSTGTVLSDISYTPRVREYFPETLLWIPELITDKNGEATTKVKLADSVTTWKVAVIASTQDGRIAEAETDFKTFQPFFLDFNPPQVLTEGDQISLPVTVRNYLDKAQKADIRFVPNDWSALRSNATQQISVPANASVNVNFDMQAKSSKDKAAQRIIAEAGKNSDAIEKSFRIHPDGQENIRTFGDLVAGPTSFTVPIPQNAIKAGTRGELRIYPNIASLLFESAAAILEAPHSCAEQTISAGYANLVALRFARSVGIKDEKIEKQALENIRLTLDRVKALRNYDGGVPYWSSGKPDSAVTAYALSFLMDASAIIDSDPDDMDSMISWLEKNQSSDGRWISSSNQDQQTLLLTSTIARVLAAAVYNNFKVKSGTLGAAYHHIAALTDSIDEPYMLASFILAALASGDESLLKDAAARLASLAHEERGGVYWDLQTNTPFYGWGTAGRYETTGLAISALSAWHSKHPETKELDALIRRGLVFLLRGRNHNGYWGSTQSTLQAMRAMVDASAVLGNFGNQSGTLEIRSNDRVVKSITIAADSKAVDPILIDMSAFLAPGNNQISLLPSAGMQAAMTLFSSTHWLPWNQTESRTSPELRLNIQFDKPETRVGDLIRCSVKAERIGFHGYGMMIAEIGLPPGTEVDRASLEKLIEDGTGGINQYEVMPDRVLFYLWPTAGGASFQFNLSARFPMNAKSEPSVLYDYYNPEALSEVPPTPFIVK